MCQLLGKMPVVRQQNNACRASVQSSNRKNTVRRCIRYQIHYCFSGFFILGSRNISFWFIQENINRFFWCNSLTVKHYPIGFLYLITHFSYHFSIHLYQSLTDQFICLSPTANSGIGDIFIQSDGILMNVFFYFLKSSFLNKTSGSVLLSFRSFIGFLVIFQIPFFVFISGVKGFS